MNTFKYDSLGRRIEKVSPTFTGIFAYDGQNLVEVTNSSGTVVARYQQGAGVDEPLAMLRSSSTRTIYKSSFSGTGVFATLPCLTRVELLK
jgi:hypothetical protein